LMIGGFALVAAPAEYGETGINTFIVSQDGVVYQKDLGPETLKEFSKMERFNPDDSWTPVPDDEPARYRLSRRFGTVLVGVLKCSPCTESSEDSFIMANFPSNNAAFPQAGIDSRSIFITRTYTHLVA